MSTLHARAGKISPLMIAVIVLLVVAASAGAWYFMRGDESTLPPDVKITVNGKEVDAKEFEKQGGKIELAGGGSWKPGTLINPQETMSAMLKEYFDLPAGPARDKHLDQIIDQQEKARKELGITTDSEGKPQVKTTGNPTTKPGEMKVQVRAGGAGMADSIAPETRAQMAEFVKALNDRRRERGLPPQQGIMMIKTNKQ